MKKSWAFFGVGVLWILLSGLVWIERGVPFLGIPQTNFPSERLLLKRESRPISQPSFFSYLEARWRSERLLQTAA